MKIMDFNLYSNIKGEGETLILLHGLFGSADNLGRIATELSNDFKVHALDLRNHGQSFHSDEMDYALMAQDVINYMDFNTIESACFIGHSMGGKVAMTLALEFPERVRKLIVADISPVTYPAHHNEIFSGLLAINLVRDKTRNAADKVLAEYVGEKGVRQFLLKNLQTVVEGGLKWRVNLDAIYDNYKNILQGMKDDKVYKGSVLFIAGALSDYIKPEYKEKTLNLFPNTQMKVIPEATHWLHAEKPRIFIGICKRFLEK